jgi:hypothetical protein
MFFLSRMTSAGDYTVLKQIIGNYSFEGGKAWTTNQPIVTTNTTQSTGSGTGALVVNGGAAIAGNLYVNNVRVPIIQSGTVVSTGTTFLFTLPNSFSYSSTAYSVFLTVQASAAAAVNTPTYSIQTSSSFNIYNVANGVTVSWMTVGV